RDVRCARLRCRTGWKPALSADAGVLQWSAIPAEFACPASRAGKWIYGKPIRPQSRPPDDQTGRWPLHWQKSPGPSWWTICVEINVKGYAVRTQHRPTQEIANRPAHAQWYRR